MFEIETKVYNKSKKLPVHVSSKILTKYKRNAITGEIHRAKRISNNFNFEYFNKNKDDFIIPKWLFDERRLIFL